MLSPWLRVAESLNEVLFQCIAGSVLLMANHRRIGRLCPSPSPSSSVLLCVGSHAVVLPLFCGTSVCWQLSQGSWGRCGALAEQSVQQTGKQLTCFGTALGLGCHVPAGQRRSQQRLPGFIISAAIKGSWLLWGLFARAVTMFIGRGSPHPEQPVILKERRRTGAQPAE